MLFTIHRSILHSRVGSIVAVAAARHSASLADVVHPLDFVLPDVDVAPVLPLQDPRSRHQGVEVLSTADLRKGMTISSLCSRKVG